MDDMHARDALRVVTANVRLIAANASPDHPDHWSRRRPVLEANLRNLRPHLLGVQELVWDQFPALAAALPAHRLVGTGREGGSHGEHSAILYDPDRLDLRAWDQCWLSPTPELIGSTGWGATLPRIAVRAQFSDRRTGIAFTMVNTHLDHSSEQAREQGAAIVARLAAGPEPVVVTGDFNAERGASRPWQLLRDAGLDDARRDTGATFHNYTETCRSDIDWILARGWTTLSSRVVDDRIAGQPASDHAFVLAELVPQD